VFRSLFSASEKAEMLVNLNGVELPFVFVPQKRRTLAVRWDENIERFVFKYPMHTTQEYRRQFLETHAGKIIKAYESMKRRRHYSDGAILPLYGNSITLSFKLAGKRSFEITDNRLTVKVPAIDQDSIRTVLHRFYTRQAEGIIPKLVQQLSCEMNVTFKSITLRNQKTRWGSASASGALNFNYRLILAPPEIVRYVVIHELAHLAHMNHSSDFWKYVCTFDPLYKDHRKWLRVHAQDLAL